MDLLGKTQLELSFARDSLSELPALAKLLESWQRFACAVEREVELSANEGVLWRAYFFIGKSAKRQPCLQADVYKTDSGTDVQGYLRVLFNAHRISFYRGKGFVCCGKKAAVKKIARSLKGRYLPGLDIE